MESPWVRFDVREQSEQAFDAAVEAIRAGQCIVVPTDTLYGIAVDAFSPTAVARLLAAKGRGRDMPPPVLIAEPKMFTAFAESPPWFAIQLAERFWPGPLTLILTAQPSLEIDVGESAGTIAMRVPDSEFTRELLRRTGALAVSSANVTGQEPATTIDRAITMLGDSVAVYLDEGEVEGGIASTIVDFVTTSTGRIVREGALSFDELRNVAPNLTEFAANMADDNELRKRGEQEESTSEGQAD